MPDTSAPVTAEGLRERIAEALNLHEWEPAQRHTAHRKHDYHWACAVCQEDLPRIAEVALAALAGDPGDLPARMAAAMHAADCGCEDGHDGWYQRLAAAALSVRWKDAAGLAAENARLRAALEESQGNTSAYHEHMVAAQGERDRHRAGMAAASRRAELADVEVERLRAEQRIANEDIKIADEQVERLRAELAETQAERDTNFSLVGRLSTSGFACATQLELMTQARDSEKARADDLNARADQLFAVVTQHAQLIREAEAERDALEIKFADERTRTGQLADEVNQAEAELAEARAAIEGKAIVDKAHLAEILTFVAGDGEIQTLSNATLGGLFAALKTALDAPTGGED